MASARRVALQNVATIEREIVSPSQIASGTMYVGLENIESGGKFVGVGPVHNGELASSKFAFTPRHVLYGKLRPYLAKIARPDFDGICSTDILPVLPGPDLDRGYLAWLLLSPHMVSWAASQATGANLPRLSPRTLAKMEIPLPPLAEQRRIAAILDAADALRVKRRAAIAKLDELTQSIFLDMFGDPATNPKGWARVTLADVCGDADDIKCGPFGTQLSQSEYTDAGVPLWGIRHVNASFAVTTREFLSVNTAERLASYSIVPGDIVMTRKGTVGNCAVYPRGMPLGIMHSDLLRLRVDGKRCDPTFVAHQLHTSRDVDRQIVAISGGAVMPGINVTKLKRLEIALPPILEQRRFAKGTAVISEQRLKASTSFEQLGSLFASLQHRAFRGEL